MKIAFLCSSLAPGRNGVGDYARRLAAALAEEGHVCRLFALHERQPLVAEGDETLLFARQSWGDRARRLAAALGDFAPDHVSWQLVPYGYHPKGLLPPGLALLADATRAWPRHVMLHELWIGLAAGERWSDRVVGGWQRRRLLAFLDRLQPAVVHTSNPAYQAALHGLGRNAAVLPLFGNIPIVEATEAAGAAALAAAAGAALPPAPRWVVVTFGTVHPQWPADATAAWLLAASLSSGREILLLALGRAGAHGEARFARLAQRYPGIRFAVAGAAPAATISHLLQAADFGLATHPWALIGKSGGTAAMCEHGLPVLVPRDDWRLPAGAEAGDPGEPLLARLAHVPPSGVGSWLRQRRAPASRLPAVTAQFVRELTGSSARPVLA